MSRQSNTKQRQRAAQTSAQKHHPVQHEVVDPRWLLRTGATVVVIAVICGYLTACGLFYFGQWQFVLHPTARVTQTPADVSLPFQADTLAAHSSRGRRLSSWTLPSDSPADPVALLLHGADGNLGSTVALIQKLHAARLKVVAFDYGGYGATGGPHPTQQSMTADADAAYRALAATRPASIVLVGQGVGAALAVELAARHPEVAAVILDQPRGDLEPVVAHDTRARFLPVALLFHNSFALQGPLKTLGTPKLIVTDREEPPPLDARLAADPKLTVELAAGDRTAYVASVRRFLDSYVAHPVPTLLLPAAPK